MNKIMYENEINNMVRITEEKTYTLWLDDVEMNKLNNGKVFEIEFNGSKVFIKKDV